jgi:hypothetical protein
MRRGSLADAAFGGTGVTTSGICNVCVRTLRFAFSRALNLGAPPPPKSLRVVPNVSGPPVPTGGMLERDPFDGALGAEAAGDAAAVGGSESTAAC